MVVPNAELSQGLSNLAIGDLSYEDAVRELIKDPTYLEARAFYNGDHWQKREAWIGPHPDVDDPDAAMVWDEIERGLIPHPAVEEVTNRHRDAIVGQEPFWSWVPKRPMKPDEKPTEAEQTLIDELEAALTTWWDDHDCLDIFQKAIEDLALGGRGLIRMFVPEGNLSTSETGNTFIEDSPFEEALEKVWPTFIPADEGAVPRDPRTMKEFGVFHFEIQEAIGGASEKFVELTYLSPEGKTVIKTIPQNPPQAGQVPQPTELELGRHLTMFEMRSKPLITEPILGNQKMLNKTMTMLGRNVDLGGFLERVILNGQLPGEFEIQADGKRVFVEYDFKLGPGTTNSIRGVQVGVKEDGSAIIAEPRMQYRDPVDVSCFKQSVAIAYMNVLSAARQIHVLIAADATASGEARKQARDDYTKSLKRTKTRMDRAGRWVLELATLYGELFSKQLGKYTSKLRCVFNSQLDPGPISADDRAAVVSEYQVDLRSQEGSMALLGIDDTAAEQATIAAEKAAAAAAAEANMTPQEKLLHERAKVGLAADQKALESGNLPPRPTPPVA